jgi:anti-anti-sigma regulatory factor
MEIVVSQMQGRVPVTVFQIKGNIDANFYDQLVAQAQAAFEAGTRDLILDLTQVKYMSSSGLRALHSIFVMLRSSAPGESDEAMKKGLSDGTFKSPHLKLVNPSPAVRDVIKTTGFDMFLEIHRNLKEAVASF